MKLLLLRHGETLFNVLDYTQGWCDSPLTEKGIQQAKQAGEFLKNISIDQVYSSDSGRTYETAEIATEGHNITIKRDKRLRELNFGTFEGSPFCIRHSQYVNSGWKEMDYRPFNGEHEDDMHNRYVDFFNNELKDDNQTTLLVAHGAALTFFVRKMWSESLYKADPNFHFFGNGTIIVLEGNKSHLEVTEVIHIGEQPNVINDTKKS